MSRRRPVRIIATVLALTVMAQELAFAAPDASAPDWGGWSVRGGKADLPKAGFEVPASAGFVEDGYRAPGVSAGGGSSGDRLVVILQDAHVNPSAQLNAARIIDTIARSGTARTVFTEGAHGDIGLSAWMDTGPSAARRTREAAEALVRKGRLSGFELADLRDPGRIELWGVEEEAFYDEALALYRTAATERKAALEFLDRVERACAALGDELLDGSVRELLILRSQHDAGTLSTVAYYDRLSRIGPAAGRKNLRLLRRLAREETRIDAERLAIEQAEALATLADGERDALGGPDASAGLSAQYAYWQSAIAAGAVVRRRSMLDRYIRYLARCRELDALAVSEELERFEEEVLFGAARTPDAATLLRVMRNARTLKAIVSLQASPADVERYGRERASHDAARLTAFLNARIHALGRYYDRAVFLSDAYERAEKAAREFYAVSARRDGAMVRNLIDRMDRSGLDRAVLVAGGHHAPGLKRELRARGVSYLSVIPAVLHPTDTGLYEKVLLSQPGPVAGPLVRPSSGLIPRPLRARFADPDDRAARTSVEQLGLKPPPVLRRGPASSASRMALVDAKHVHEQYPDSPLAALALELSDLQERSRNQSLSGQELDRLLTILNRASRLIEGQDSDVDLLHWDGAVLVQASKHQGAGSLVGNGRRVIQAALKAEKRPGGEAVWAAASIYAEAVRSIQQHYDRIGHEAADRKDPARWSRYRTAHAFLESYIAMHEEAPGRDRERLSKLRRSLSVSFRHIGRLDLAARELRSLMAQGYFDPVVETEMGYGYLQQAERDFKRLISAGEQGDKALALGLYEKALSGLQDARRHFSRVTRKTTLSTAHDQAPVKQAARSFSGAAASHALETALHLEAHRSGMARRPRAYRTAAFSAAVKSLRSVAGSIRYAKDPSAVDHSVRICVQSMKRIVALAETAFNADDQVVAKERSELSDCLALIDKFLEAVETLKASVNGDPALGAVQTGIATVVQKLKDLKSGLEKRLEEIEHARERILQSLNKGSHPEERDRSFFDLDAVQMALLRWYFADPTAPIHDIRELADADLADLARASTADRIASDERAMELIDLLRSKGLIESKPTDKALPEVIEIPDPKANRANGKGQQPVTYDIPNARSFAETDDSLINPLYQRWEVIKSWIGDERTKTRTQIEADLDQVRSQRSRYLEGVALLPASKKDKSKEHALKPDEIKALLENLTELRSGSTDGAVHRIGYWARREDLARRFDNQEAAIDRVIRSRQEEIARLRDRLRELNAPLQFSWLNEDARRLTAQIEVLEDIRNENNVSEYLSKDLYDEVIAAMEEVRSKLELVEHDLETLSGIRSRITLVRDGLNVIERTGQFPHIAAKSALQEVRDIESVFQNTAASVDDHVWQPLLDRLNRSEDRLEELKLLSMVRTSFDEKLEPYWSASIPSAVAAQWLPEDQVRSLELAASDKKRLDLAMEQLDLEDDADRMSPTATSVEDWVERHGEVCMGVQRHRSAVIAGEIDALSDMLKELRSGAEAFLTDKEKMSGPGKELMDGLEAAAAQISALALSFRLQSPTIDQDIVRTKDVILSASRLFAHFKTQAVKPKIQSIATSVRRYVIDHWREFVDDSTWSMPRVEKLEVTAPIISGLFDQTDLVLSMTLTTDSGKSRDLTLRSADHPWIDLSTLKDWETFGDPDRGRPIPMIEALFFAITTILIYQQIHMRDAYEMALPGLEDVIEVNMGQVQALRLSLARDVIGQQPNLKRHMFKDDEAILDWVRSTGGSVRSGLAYLIGRARTSAARDSERSSLVPSRIAPADLDRIRSLVDISNMPEIPSDLLSSQTTQAVSAPGQADLKTSLDAAFGKSPIKPPFMSGRKIMNADADRLTDTLLHLFRDELSEVARERDRVGYEILTGVMYVIIEHLGIEHALMRPLVRYAIQRLRFGASPEVSESRVSLRPVFEEPPADGEFHDRFKIVLPTVKEPGPWQGEPHMLAFWPIMLNLAVTAVFFYITERAGRAEDKQQTFDRLGVNGFVTMLAGALLMKMADQLKLNDEQRSHIAYNTWMSLMGMPGETLADKLLYADLLVGWIHGEERKDEIGKFMDKLYTALSDVGISDLMQADDDSFASHKGDFIQAVESAWQSIQRDDSISPESLFKKDDPFAARMTVANKLFDERERLTQFFEGKHEEIRAGIGGLSESDARAALEATILYYERVFFFKNTHDDDASEHGHLGRNLDSVRRSADLRGAAEQSLEHRVMDGFRNRKQSEAEVWQGILEVLGRQPERMDLVREYFRRAAEAFNRDSAVQGSKHLLKYEGYYRSDRRKLRSLIQLLIQKQIKAGITMSQEDFLKGLLRRRFSDAGNKVWDVGRVAAFGRHVRLIHNDAGFSVAHPHQQAFFIPSDFIPESRIGIERYMDDHPGMLRWNEDDGNAFREGELVGWPSSTVVVEGSNDARVAKRVHERTQELLAKGHSFNLMLTTTHDLKPRFVIFARRSRKIPESLRPNPAVFGNAWGTPEMGGMMVIPNLLNSNTGSERLESIRYEDLIEAYRQTTAPPVHEIFGWPADPAGDLRQPVPNDEEMKKYFDLFYMPSRDMRSRAGGMKGAGPGDLLHHYHMPDGQEVLRVRDNLSIAVNPFPFAPNSLVLLSDSIGPQELTLEAALWMLEIWREVASSARMAQGRGSVAGAELDPFDPKKHIAITSDGLGKYYGVHRQRILEPFDFLPDPGSTPRRTLVHEGIEFFRVTNKTRIIWVVRKRQKGRLDVLTGFAHKGSEAARPGRKFSGGAKDRARPLFVRLASYDPLLDIAFSVPGIGGRYEAGTRIIRRTLTGLPPAETHAEDTVEFKGLTLERKTSGPRIIWTYPLLGQGLIEVGKALQLKPRGVAAAEWPHEVMDARRNRAKKAPRVRRVRVEVARPVQKTAPRAKTPPAPAAPAAVSVEDRLKVIEPIFRGRSIPGRLDIWVGPGADQDLARERLTLLSDTASDTGAIAWARRQGLLSVRKVGASAGGTHYEARLTPEAIRDYRSTSDSILGSLGVRSTSSNGRVYQINRKWLRGVQPVAAGQIRGIALGLPSKTAARMSDPLLKELEDMPPSGAGGAVNADLTSGDRRVLTAIMAEWKPEMNGIFLRDESDAIWFEYLAERFKVTRDAEEKSDHFRRDLPADRRTEYLWRVTLLRELAHALWSATSPIPAGWERTPGIPAEFVEEVVEADGGKQYLAGGSRERVVRVLDAAAADAAREWIAAQPSELQYISGRVSVSTFEDSPALNELGCLVALTGAWLGDAAQLVRLYQGNLVQTLAPARSRASRHDLGWAAAEEMEMAAKRIFWRAYRDGKPWLGRFKSYARMKNSSEMSRNVSNRLREREGIPVSFDAPLSGNGRDQDRDSGRWSEVLHDAALGERTYGRLGRAADAERIITDAKRILFGLMNSTRLRSESEGDVQRRVDEHFEDYLNYHKGTLADGGRLKDIGRARGDITHQAINWRFKAVEDALARARSPQRSFLGRWREKVRSQQVPDILNKANGKDRERTLLHRLMSDKSPTVSATSRGGSGSPKRINAFVAGQKIEIPDSVHKELQAALGLTVDRGRLAEYLHLAMHTPENWRFFRLYYHYKAEVGPVSPNSSAVYTAIERDYRANGWPMPKFPNQVRLKMMNRLKAVVKKGRTGREWLAADAKIPSAAVTDGLIALLPPEEQLLIRRHYGIGVFMPGDRDFSKTVLRDLEAHAPTGAERWTTRQTIIFARRAVVRDLADYARSTRREGLFRLPPRLRRGKGHTTGWDVLVHDLNRERRAGSQLRQRLLKDADITEDRLRMLKPHLRLAIETFYCLDGVNRKAEAAFALVGDLLKDADLGRQDAVANEQSYGRWVREARHLLASYADGWDLAAGETFEGEGISAGDVRDRFPGLSMLEADVFVGIHGIDRQAASSQGQLAGELNEGGRHPHLQDRSSVSSALARANARIRGVAKAARMAGREWTLGAVRASRGEGGLHGLTGPAAAERARVLLKEGFVAGVDDLEAVRLLRADPDLADGVVGIFVTDDAELARAGAVSGTNVLLGVAELSEAAIRAARDANPEIVIFSQIDAKDLSAAQTADAAREAFARGADGVIIKPYFDVAGDRPVLSPELLSGIATAFPDRIVMPAGGIFGARLPEVLDLPQANVVPALGFRADTLDEFRAQVHAVPPRKAAARMTSFEERIRQLRDEVAADRAVTPAVYAITVAYASWGIFELARAAGMGAGAWFWAGALWTFHTGLFSLAFFIPWFHRERLLRALVRVGRAADTKTRLDALNRLFDLVSGHKDRMGVQFLIDEAVGYSNAVLPVRPVPELTGALLASMVEAKLGTAYRIDSVEMLPEGEFIVRFWIRGRVRFWRRSLSRRHEAGLAHRAWLLQNEIDRRVTPLYRVDPLSSMPAKGGGLDVALRITKLANEGKRARPLRPVAGSKPATAAASASIFGSIWARRPFRWMIYAALAGAVGWVVSLRDPGAPNTNVPAEEKAEAPAAEFVRASESVVRRLHSDRTAWVERLERVIEASGPGEIVTRIHDLLSDATDGLPLDEAQIGHMIRSADGVISAHVFGVRVGEYQPGPTSRYRPILRGRGREAAKQIIDGLILSIEKRAGLPSPPIQEPPSQVPPKENKNNNKIKKDKKRSMPLVYDESKVAMLTVDPAARMTEMDAAIRDLAVPAGEQEQGSQRLFGAWIRSAADDPEWAGGFKKLLPASRDLLRAAALEDTADELVRPVMQYVTDLVPKELQALRKTAVAWIGMRHREDHDDARSDMAFKNLMSRADALAAKKTILASFMSWKDWDPVRVAWGLWARGNALKVLDEALRLKADTSKIRRENYETYAPSERRSFGERIMQLMKISGVSTAELAFRIRVLPKALRRLEERREPFTADFIKKDPEAVVKLVSWIRKTHPSEDIALTLFGRHLSEAILLEPRASGRITVARAFLGYGYERMIKELDLQVTKSSCVYWEMDGDQGNRPDMGPITKIAHAVGVPVTLLDPLQLIRGLFGISRMEKRLAAVRQGLGLSADQVISLSPELSGWEPSTLANIEASDGSEASAGPVSGFEERRSAYRAALLRLSTLNPRYLDANVWRQELEALSLRPQRLKAVRQALLLTREELSAWFGAADGLPSYSVSQIHGYEGTQRVRTASQDYGDRLADLAGLPRSLLGGGRGPRAIRADAHPSSARMSDRQGILRRQEGDPHSGPGQTDAGDHPAALERSLQDLFPQATSGELKALAQVLSEWPSEMAGIVMRDPKDQTWLKEWLMHPQTTGIRSAPEGAASWLASLDRQYQLTLETEAKSKHFAKISQDRRNEFVARITLLREVARGVWDATNPVPADWSKERGIPAEFVEEVVRVAEDPEANDLLKHRTKGPEPGSTALKHWLKAQPSELMYIPGRSAEEETSLYPPVLNELGCLTEILKARTGDPAALVRLHQGNLGPVISRIPAIAGGLEIGEADRHELEVKAKRVFWRAYRDIKPWRGRFRNYAQMKVKAELQRVMQNAQRDRRRQPFSLDAPALGLADGSGDRTGHDTLREGADHDGGFHGAWDRMDSDGQRSEALRILTKAKQILYDKWSRIRAGEEPDAVRRRVDLVFELFTRHARGDDEDHATYDQIAAALGMKRQRVGQIFDEVREALEQARKKSPHLSLPMARDRRADGPGRRADSIKDLMDQAAGRDLERTLVWRLTRANKGRSASAGIKSRKAARSGPAFRFFEEHKVDLSEEVMESLSEEIGSRPGRERMVPYIHAALNKPEYWRFLERYHHYKKVHEKAGVSERTASHSAYQDMRTEYAAKGWVWPKHHHIFKGKLTKRLQAAARSGLTGREKLARDAKLLKDAITDELLALLPWEEELLIRRHYGIDVFEPGQQDFSRTVLADLHRHAPKGVERWTHTGTIVTVKQQIIKDLVSYARSPRREALFILPQRLRRDGKIFKTGRDVLIHDLGLLTEELARGRRPLTAADLTEERMRVLDPLERLAIETFYCLDGVGRSTQESFELIRSLMDQADLGPHRFETQRAYSNWLRSARSKLIRYADGWEYAADSPNLVGRVTVAQMKDRISGLSRLEVFIFNGLHGIGRQAAVSYAQLSRESNEGASERAANSSVGSIVTTWANAQDRLLGLRPAARSDRTFLTARMADGDAFLKAVMSDEPVRRDLEAMGVDIPWLTALSAAKVGEVDPGFGRRPALTGFTFGVEENAAQAEVLKKDLRALIRRRAATGDRRLFLVQAGVGKAANETADLLELIRESMTAEGEESVGWGIDLLLIDMSAAVIDAARRSFGNTLPDGIRLQYETADLLDEEAMTVLARRRTPTGMSGADYFLARHIFYENTNALKMRDLTLPTPERFAAWKAGEAPGNLYGLVRLTASTIALKNAMRSFGRAADAQEPGTRYLIDPALPEDPATDAAFVPDGMHPVGPALKGVMELTDAAVVGGLGLRAAQAGYRAHRPVISPEFMSKYDADIRRAEADGAITRAKHVPEDGFALSKGLSVSNTRPLSDEAAKVFRWLLQASDEDPSILELGPGAGQAISDMSREAASLEREVRIHALGLTALAPRFRMRAQEAGLTEDAFEELEEPFIARQYVGELLSPEIVLERGGYRMVHDDTGAFYYTAQVMGVLDDEFGIRALGKVVDALAPDGVFYYEHENAVIPYFQRLMRSYPKLNRSFMVLGWGWGSRAMVIRSDGPLARRARKDARVRHMDGIWTAPDLPTLLKVLSGTRMADASRPASVWLGPAHPSRLELGEVLFEDMTLEEKELLRAAAVRILDDQPGRILASGVSGADRLAMGLERGFAVIGVVRTPEGGVRLMIGDHVLAEWASEQALREAVRTSLTIGGVDARQMKALAVSVGDLDGELIRAASSAAAHQAASGRSFATWTQVRTAQLLPSDGRFRRLEMKLLLESLKWLNRQEVFEKDRYYLDPKDLSEAEIKMMEKFIAASDAQRIHIGTFTEADLSADPDAVPSQWYADEPSQAQGWVNVLMPDPQEGLMPVGRARHAAQLAVAGTLTGSKVEAGSRASFRSAQRFDDDLYRQNVLPIYGETQDVFGSAEGYLNAVRGTGSLKLTRRLPFHPVRAGARLSALGRALSQVAVMA